MWPNLKTYGNGEQITKGGANSAPPPAANRVKTLKILIIQ